MERVLSVVLAGGLGERLRPLTLERSKASVPFGGKYRLIDFTLSNCVNSGLRQIYVLIQYRSGSLLEHVQEGWGISGAGLGDYIYCVPAQQKMGADWYKGTADAIRQNLDMIKGKKIDSVLVLSGDHIYKMDYTALVAYHKARDAEVTICAVRVRKEDAARRLGVLEVDRDYRLVGFQEKPEEPKTLESAPEYSLGSMGVYLFKVETLIHSLEEPGDDFGKDVIPHMITHGHSVFVYDYDRENKIEDFVVQVREGKRHKLLVEATRDSAYWRDVGTIDSYYEASMDLVGVDPSFNLYGERWPFRTVQRQLPPTKFVLGGNAPESLVSEGCIISGGAARNCILSPGVVIEKDALVQNSIVFDDTNIEPSARIRRAILDKQVKVLAGATLGYDPDADRRRGCTVTESGIAVVPKGAEIGPV